MKNYINRQISPVTIGLSILIIGLVVYLVNNNESKQKGLYGGGSIELPALKIKEENAAISIVIPARVVAYKKAEIRPQVSGIILKQLFKEGSYVKEGQQLYQVDSTIYNAEFKQAEADWEKAEADLKYAELQYNRYKNLVKENAASKQQYDDILTNYTNAKARITHAKAKLDITKAKLDYTKIYAPIGGFISKSSVTVGALVTANQIEALATINELNPAYVDIKLPSSKKDIISLLHNEDSSVNLILDNDQKYEQQGKLLFSELAVNESTDAIELRTIFPNPDNKLLPGSFVRIEFKIHIRNVLSIPQHAAIRQPDGSVMAFLVGEDGKLEQVSIELGESYQGKWLLKSGIRSGDTIILEGFQKVMPGMFVKPIYKQEENS